MSLIVRKSWNSSLRRVSLAFAPTGRRNARFSKCCGSADCRARSKTHLLTSTAFYSSTPDSAKSVREKESKALTAERKELSLEARQITLSFYRMCVRCIREVRKGNQRDEKEFREREEARLSKKDSFSFEPPVERDNELSSRADYYLDWTHEEIHQESDCLNDELWLDDTVDRYLFYIRRGEKQRKWILKDYEFDDPYPQSFDNKRVDRFESRARELVKQTYEFKGWRHKDSHVLGRDDDDSW